MRGIWIACLLTVGAYAAEEAPRVLIEDFHAALIAGMQSTGGFEARLATVAPAVDAAFDVQSIARISLGKSWRAMDAAARADFVALMRELISTTYAGRFSSFDGQRFETEAAQEVRPGRWVVKTRLVRANGEVVTLDYYLRDGRVFNVVANGVSDLSLRRADYAAIVEQSGLEGLIADVRTSIAELRDEG